MLKKLRIVDMLNNELYAYAKHQNFRINLDEYINDLYDELNIHDKISIQSLQYGLESVSKYVPDNEAHKLCNNIDN